MFDQVVANHHEGQEDDRDEAVGNAPVALAHRRLFRHRANCDYLRSRLALPTFARRTTGRTPAFALPAPPGAGLARIFGVVNVVCSVWISLLLCQRPASRDQV